MGLLCCHTLSLHFLKSFQISGRSRLACDSVNLSPFFLQRQDLSPLFLRRQDLSPFFPRRQNLSPFFLRGLRKQDQPCGAGSSFNQLRTAAAVEALHAPPFNKFDPLLLASKPSLTQALPAAMHSLPKLGQRLTACAVWAKACLADLADLDPGSQEAAATVPAVSQFLLKSTPPAHCSLLAEKGVFQVVCELQKSPHPLCSKSAEQGVFQVVYELLLLGLQVGCE